MVNGPLVGIGRIGFVVAVLAYHPVVVVATGVALLYHFVNPLATGHAAGADALELLTVGKIDVQAHAIGEPVGQHAPNHPTHIVAQMLLTGLGIVVAVRERHRGDALQTAFDGHTHGARVVTVNGRVVAVVDAP